MRYLIDTNIIIDHFRGDSIVTNFLIETENSQIPMAISAITEYELLAAEKLTIKQEKHIHEFLKNIPSLAVTSTIVHAAVYFRRKYRADIADALIAATAYKTSATLVTRNIKHFSHIKEIKIASL